MAGSVNIVCSGQRTYWKRLRRSIDCLMLFIVGGAEFQVAAVLGCRLAAAVAKSEGRFVDAFVYLIT